MQLTSEQLAVVHEFKTGTSSLMVEALAGAAKTTTIEKATFALDPNPGEVLCVAFNRKIADTLKERVHPSCVTATLNSLGHRAWTDFVKKKLTLDKDKLYHVIQDVLNEASVHEDEFAEVAINVRGLVNAAKNAGLIPKSGLDPLAHRLAKGFYPDEDDAWEELGYTYDCDVNNNYIAHARQALRRSISRAFQGYIDFNDQLYMSTCFPATFPTYKTVVVDEAQDLSVLNHHMLKRMVKLGGRLVAVGDRYQSIYAFRGADLNSVDRLKEMFSMKTLQLSTTFRCSKEVAEHVKDRVPHIQSPEWAKKGGVEFRGRDWNIKGIPEGAAILCRNNKPLIRLAYQFIRARRPVVINGGDFGEVLIKLLKKICKANSSSQKKNDERLACMGISDLENAIHAWEKEEISKAKAQNKEFRIGGIQDKAGSLYVVLESCRGQNGKDILSEIEQIFSNKHGSITLSSGHKSKGLEWETVYILDAHLCPSKWALRKAEEGDEGALNQELNLRYVMATRAKDRLIYIDSEDEEKSVDNLETNHDNVDSGNSHGDLDESVIESPAPEMDEDFNKWLQEEISNGNG